MRNENQKKGRAAEPANAEQKHSQFNTANNQKGFVSARAVCIDSAINKKAFGLYLDPSRTDF
jgi:hypothetical protein